MSSLINLLTKFVYSSERNMQLDFFSMNQIVLQIYKRSDVQNWNFGIETYIADDLIVELTFNKNKLNNQSNKQRFLGSIVFKDFIKVDTVNTDSYWTGISINQDINHIQQKIQIIISSVYDLKNQKLEYSLTAY